MKEFMQVLRFVKKTADYLNQGVHYDSVKPVFPLDVWTVPVLVIAFYPERRGQLDIRITHDVEGPLSTIRAHVKDTNKKVLHALQVGSIFRGYQNPAAQPSLRYEIVEWVEFRKPHPTYKVANDDMPWVDYNAIMERVNLKHWVEERGVKEVWIWGYYGHTKGWESNMSGPYGDISNSNRDPHDLPVFNRTYTVYHYNYQRGPSEATENHIHQIESILGHIDKEMFWNLFVGQPGDRHCGCAHFPPNGVRDYDWGNLQSVMSDIEDWKPDGTGQKKSINSLRWNSNSLTWFTYWMQSIPGRNHRLSYQGQPLTNWWRFIGDFDGALADGMGLYEGGGRTHPQQTFN